MTTAKRRTGNSATFVADNNHHYTSLNQQQQQQQQQQLQQSHQQYLNQNYYNQQQNNHENQRLLQQEPTLSSNSNTTTQRHHQPYPNYNATACSNTSTAAAANTSTSSASIMRGECSVKLPLDILWLPKSAMRPAGPDASHTDCILVVGVSRPKLAVVFLTVMLISLFLTFHVLYDSAVYNIQAAQAVHEHHHQRLALMKSNSIGKGGGGGGPGGGSSSGSTKSFITNRVNHLPEDYDGGGGGAGGVGFGSSSTNYQHLPDISSSNQQISHPMVFPSNRVHFPKTSRRLPQALIIGIRKCGTRALLEMLYLHPRIQKAGGEVHFFDRDENYMKGLEWYRKKMPHSFRGQITIEKSPSYFVSPEIPCDKKFQLQQHIVTSLHRRSKASNDNNDENAHNSSNTSSNLSDSSNNEFKSDLCEALVAGNIPWNVLSNATFNNFLKKYTGQPIPDESTLRKNYLDKCYQESIKKIRDSIKEESIWISVDETTDKQGRYVANLIVGILSENESSGSFLLSCKQLEQVNNATIARFVNDSIRILWPHGNESKVLLLLTDAAAYMIKAGKNLKVFYPNLIHITCLAHGLNLIAEKVRTSFPVANSFISCVKKIFVKAPLRVQLYKQIVNKELPPEPIITRWGTWLKAASFYADNMDGITEVPERVRAMNASIKLLLIVREPVTRAISDYTQLRSHAATAILPLANDQQQQQQQQLQHEQPTTSSASTNAGKMPSHSMLLNKLNAGYSSSQVYDNSLGGGGGRGSGNGNGNGNVYGSGAGGIKINLKNSYNTHRRYEPTTASPQTNLANSAAQILSKSFEELAIFPNGTVNESYRPLSISMYHLHLHRWLEVFPREQILIVNGDRLIDDPVSQLKKIESFLGIEHRITSNHFYFNETKGFYCLRYDSGDRCLRETKGRKHPHVDPVVISKLRKFFAEHNQRFYELVGEDLGWPEE